MLYYLTYWGGYGFSGVVFSYGVLAKTIYGSNRF